MQNSVGAAIEITDTGIKTGTGYEAERHARAETIVLCIRALDILCKNARGTWLEVQARHLEAGRPIFLDLLAEAGEPLLLEVNPQPEAPQGSRKVF